MYDPEIHKLGKQPPKRDPRDFKLSKYLTTLPRIPPVQRDWGAGIVNWGGALGNARYGDCTCAAVGHALMAWTYNTGQMITPTDAEVLAMYSAVTGFNAGPPVVNDNGAYITDVLNYWRKSGLRGHKLGAYASVEIDDPKWLRTAISLFGVVNLGLALPITAQSQWHGVWYSADGSTQGNAAPWSWGGHSVPVFGYNVPKKTFLINTWGGLWQVKWEFIKLYCDEAWALLSSDWVTGDKPAPSGFDLATLQADLQSLHA